MGGGMFIRKSCRVTRHVTMRLKWKDNMSQPNRPGLLESTIPTAR